ncbi:hypothetical protein [Myxosarcina sp. GI1(2024)]
MTEFLGSLAKFLALQYLKFRLLEKIFNFQNQIRLSTPFVRNTGYAWVSQANRTTLLRIGISCDRPPQKTNSISSAIAKIFSRLKVCQSS